MSMDHKAFEFDYNTFKKEFAPILYQALESNDIQLILKFIEGNIDILTDPYEGQHLSKTWEKMLSNRDVHEYADYALTKYYNPRNNFGISDCWIELYDKLSPELQLATLGEPFGPESNFFDPGRQGSYFQSPDLAYKNLSALKSIPSEIVLTDMDTKSVNTFLELFARVIDEQKGIYITF